MKSWKGWANAVGDIIQPDKTKYFTRPVIVIDASDFPEGYPEIGSEWLLDGTVVTVSTNPYQASCDTWRVLVRSGRGVASFTDIARLTTPPKTAKGEVVGSITFGDEATSWGTDNAPIPHGTYYIIKRGDK